MRLLAGALALCATFQVATAQCADLDVDGTVGVNVRSLTACSYRADMSDGLEIRCWQIPAYTA